MKLYMLYELCSKNRPKLVVKINVEVGLLLTRCFVIQCAYIVTVFLAYAVVRLRCELTQLNWIDKFLIREVKKNWVKFFYQTFIFDNSSTNVSKVLSIQSNLHLYKLFYRNDQSNSLDYYIFICFQYFLILLPTN